MSEIPSLEPTVELSDEVLDIQHDTDPADDHGPARRIPHLGHAILFFSIAWMMLNLAAVVCFMLAHISTVDEIKNHPGVALSAEAISYVLTLLISVSLFPRLWQRSFLHGLQWNVLAVHRRWMWLIPAGIACSLLAQLADHYVHPPDNDMLAQLMHTRHGAWLVTAFGVLLAPLMEEIAFRGFLLPAFATAYDWLALDRTPAGLRHWEMTSAHTTPAVVFAAIFSSIPFALLHAGQLSHAWGAIAVLYAVSLALSFARIKTHSVAASTLMHATYNFTVFLVAFIATGGYRHLDKL